jgi:hypothetical protein
MPRTTSTACCNARGVPGAANNCSASGSGGRRRPRPRLRPGQARYGLGHAKVILSSLLLQDEDVEYYCPCCDKTFRSEKQMADHERSKKHLQACLSPSWVVIGSKVGSNWVTYIWLVGRFGRYVPEVSRLIGLTQIGKRMNNIPFFQGHSIKRNLRAQG